MCMCLVVYDRGELRNERGFVSFCIIISSFYTIGISFMARGRLLRCSRSEVVFRYALEIGRQSEHISRTDVKCTDPETFTEIETIWNPPHAFA